MSVVASKAATLDHETIGRRTAAAEKKLRGTRPDVFDLKTKEAILRAAILSLVVFDEGWLLDGALAASTWKKHPGAFLQEILRDRMPGRRTWDRYRAMEDAVRDRAIQWRKHDAATRPPPSVQPATSPAAVGDHPYARQLAETARKMHDREKAEMN